MDAVQIRIMGDDDAVEAVVALLNEALGARLLVTGCAPTRRGPGLRVYGAVQPPTAVPARPVRHPRT